MIRRTLVSIATAAGLVAMPMSMTPLPAHAAGVPTLDHVFVIVMENHSYGEIIGSSAAPYVSGLLASGTLATRYYGVSHPSLPNYLALTSGSTDGITSDCTTCWLSAQNLGDRLESAGSTWKSYEESLPSACFIGDSYPYAQKHDPFLYYNDVRTNAARCASHVVPLSQMSVDLQSSATTPNFAFITPNMCNDMHDCSVATGDGWLQQHVPGILSSPAFRLQHSMLAITWDEDDSSAANQVPLLLLGSGVRAGYRSGVTYNHYSLLKTIEQARGLSSLNSNDLNASPIDDAFASAPTPGVCQSVSLATTRPSPQTAGSAIAVTANATGCANPQYQFWTQAPGGGYKIAQPYSSSATFNWQTAGLAAGAYYVAVWARDAGSGGTYGNSMGTWDSFVSVPYTLNSTACTGVGLVASPAVSASAGASITVTAKASGCPNPSYQFWIQPPGGAYQVIFAYSTSSWITWSTPGIAGKYYVAVWARDAQSTGTSGNSMGRWDAFVSIPYILS